MCIVLFSWQTHPQYPLIVAANRDEFHHRAATSATWRDEVLCGLDLEAGGTWLGVTRSGRFAAVTNFREPVQEPTHGRCSRGGLPMGFLKGDMSPEAYVQGLQHTMGDYGPFNLLVSDGHTLWYLSNRDARPREVPPGIHGLSNGLLGTPWPKVRRGEQQLRERTVGNFRSRELLTLLSDDWRPDDHWLPDTGVGIEMERFVAPIFIADRRYGTRASTVVRMGKGHCDWLEQSWMPGGGKAALVKESFAIDGQDARE